MHPALSETSHVSPLWAAWPCGWHPAAPGRSELSESSFGRPGDFLHLMGIGLWGLGLRV